MESSALFRMSESCGQCRRGVCNVTCLFAEVTDLFQRCGRGGLGCLEKGGETTEGLGVGGEGVEGALELGEGVWRGVRRCGRRCGSLRGVYVAE